MQADAGDRSTADQWDWYKLALDGKAPALSDDGTVRSGFFWTKASRDGGRIPVAIWTAVDGSFKCRLGTRDAARMLTLDQCLDRWTFIYCNPVSREAYKFAYESGAWPDGTPTAAPQKAGSNLPTDPFERIRAEVDDCLEKASAFMKSSGSGTAGQIDKTKADMARNIQAQALGLVKAADAMHKAEKQPHLDACRSVDEKFRFRDDLKSTAASLRGVFESFMRAEEARLRAEQERAYEAEQRRIAAERARIEAEQARRMADDPIATLTSPAPELPELPPPPAAVKVNVGGGVGRAAGLKSTWVGTITDYRACLAHFSEHQDVRTAVESLVARAVKAGKGQTKIPGVDVKQDRRSA